MSDEKLDKLDKKLDKIEDQISSINVTLAAQHVSLKEHIKRTNLLEKKLEPVEKHVYNMQGVVKVLIYGASLAALIEIIMKVVTRG